VTATAGKRILVIAGPNGAGKTAFAREFLPNEARCPVFVNADLIAAGLSPFGAGSVAVQAGRLMARQIHEHVRVGASFAFETTLSGRGYTRRIPRWRERGYRVKLFFLRLPSPEAAIARVAQRVAEGGHGVAGTGDPTAVPCRQAQLRAGLPQLGGRVGGVRQFRRRSNPRRGREQAVTETHRPAATATRDQVLAGAEAAMHRAARRARQRA